MNNSTHQKEWQLILNLVNAGLQLTKKTTKHHEIELDAIDWKIFIHLAIYHKIRPLIYMGICNLNLSSFIPSEIIAELRHFSNYFMIRNMENAKELIRVKSIFDQHNIDILPYKGIPLSALAYGNIGIRESSDIDFLIDLKDYDKIKTILENDSYIEIFIISKIFRRIHRYITCEQSYMKFETIDENKKRTFHIEPHWALGPRMFQTHINKADLQEFYSKGKFLTKEFNVLNPDGLLITAIVHHGYSDGWDFLKNVVDLVAIIETYGDELNWVKIEQFFIQHKAENLLYSGMQLVSHYFQIEFPYDQKASVAVTKIISQKINEHRKYRFDLSGPNILMNRIKHNILIRSRLKSKILIGLYCISYFSLRPFITRVRPTKDNS